jgi:hypothetical protein
MHRVFELIVTGLMPSLRHLASDRTVIRPTGLSRMSYSGLVNEADRQRFRDELRMRAIEEENKAGTAQAKLFWTWNNTSRSPWSPRTGRIGANRPP